MSKALFLLFGVVILAQYCVARPEGSGNTQLEVTDRNSLNNYGRVQIRDLAIKTINSGKKWLEDVHKEIGTMTQKNEKTQELDQQIVEFLAKASALSSTLIEADKWSTPDEEDKWVQMVKIFMEVVRLSFKYLSDVNSPDPEIKSLADLLSRNGMDSFHDQFVVDFEQCVKKVFTAIEKYVNSLPLTEKALGTNLRLISKLDRYKTEPDFKQKFEIFTSM